MREDSGEGLCITLMLASFMGGIWVGGCIAEGRAEEEAVRANVGAFVIVDQADGATEFRYACQSECCKKSKLEDR